MGIQGKSFNGSLSKEAADSEVNRLRRELLQESRKVARASNRSQTDILEEIMADIVERLPENQRRGGGPV